MTEPIILQDLFDKKLEVEFTKKDMTSDSGLLLFKPIISKLNLISNIAKILHDPRNLSLITHSQYELIEQRLSMMIAGYKDLNDHDFLRNDPVLKLFSKGANSSIELASTPTMFRLDDVVTIDECKKLVELQVKLYIERNKKKFDADFKKNGFVSINFHADPTDIETYGAQQLSLFNGYYREKCFLPMVITDGDNGDLVCGLLRPGNKHACWCLESIFSRIFKLIREKYKNVVYNIKADSGFQRESFFNFMENQKNVTFEIALATNNSLLKMVENYYEGAEIIFDNDVLKTFQEFGYKADSWSKFRRVVVKTEINRHGHDIRFVVTNEKFSARETIENYHVRCNIENRIKELKNQAGGARLSANEFRSNFFRFNLACFVVICFQEFKKKLPEDKFKTSYIETIRERFIKVAGIIKISTRRILLELSAHHPSNKYWQMLFSV